jgi:ESS family glutamate:Na+ symporter
MQLNNYETLVAASLVLLAGRRLVSAIGPLRTYSIPEPVAGGVVVALLLLLARLLFGFEVEFNPTLQSPLMLAFFATLGLSADFASLKRGGRTIALFLAVVTGLLVLQNVVGVAAATALGLNPAIGILAGSISLIGGHGTSVAWSPTIAEEFGVTAATEMAVACATFGLVLGGVIGGPVARLLLRRHVSPPVEAQAATPHNFELPGGLREITPHAVIEMLALVLVCLMVGQMLAAAAEGTPVSLPVFVWVMFTGVVLRNALAALGWYTVFDLAVSVLGNVSLSLFLAMALMSLRLWEMAALALPLVALLAMQTALTALYAIFVTHRAMGRNYDAVVLSAGVCGLGLGATPTAIANMQAITDRFGPSHIAFLVVPMVGAFFIDIVNAIAIKLSLAWLA